MKKRTITRFNFKDLCMFLLLPAILFSFKQSRNDVPDNNNIIQLAYFHYSVYDGTWSGNKTASEKVFFISKTLTVNCNPQNDCESLISNSKVKFEKDLQDLKTINPVINREQSTMRSDAEAMYDARINEYTSAKYKVIKL